MKATQEPMQNIGRNDPCICGSKKKYKHCCGAAIGKTSVAPSRHVVLPDNILATIPKAIQLGIEHHQAGRISKAEASYKAVLAAEPEHPDACHLLGLIAHQRGQYKQAVDLISRAILLNKTAAIFFNNRGEAYRCLNLLDQALADYRTAVSLQPQLVQAWHNQGLVHLLKGEPDSAAACFKTVLSIDPNHAEAHYSLGNVFVTAGKYEEAITEYQKVLAVQPQSAWAHNNIGSALRRLQRIEEAVEYHRKAVDLAPDSIDLLMHFSNASREVGRDLNAIDALVRVLKLNPKHETAAHLLDALRGVDTDSPSGDYVKHIFDNYATNFEHHLTEKLEYIGPRLVADMLRRYGYAERKLDILDLGCGTGLLGIELQPFSARLVGVDISSKMVELARGHGVYHQLLVADLQDSLMSFPPDTFDLVAAADVFVYVGNLTAAFAGANRVLRKNGLFVFTIEKTQDQKKEFTLGKSGRYSHGSAYICSLAETFGFESISMEAAPFRKEKGQAVDGLLCLLKKS